MAASSPAFGISTRAHTPSQESFCQWSLCIPQDRQSKEIDKESMKSENIKNFYNINIHE